MKGRWFKVEEMQGESSLYKGLELDWGFVVQLIEEVDSLEDSCTIYKRDGYYKVTIKTADNYIRLCEIDS